MKKVLKLVTLTAAALVLALLPNMNAMKALAAPKTYALKYDSEKKDWCFQISEWKDDASGTPSYYLNNGENRVQDGDIVVVMSGDVRIDYPEIRIDARLSNLTFLDVNAIVYANGIDECYVCRDCSASVNADVANGYVYDNAVCNFNKNVTNLHLVSVDQPVVRNDVSVIGTVAYACTETPDGIQQRYYCFAKNTFRYDHYTGLSTEESMFSRTGIGPVATNTPVAQPEPTAEPAPAPAAAADPVVVVPAPVSNDYDDVPKTGDSNLVPALLTVSAICFAGCMMLRKKENA